MDKVFLGILTRHGREHAQIFHEEIPRVLLEKRSPLVYCTEIDPVLATMQVKNLLILYRGWKAEDRLPPDARQ
jgi:hypothetical protein